MSDKTNQQAGINEEILKIRSQIDENDKKLQALINDRASLAKQIAKLKMLQEGETVYYRPEREAQVLRSIIERNKGPLNNEEMARLFREIMSACLALEEPMRVAFLGPDGTFTQQAALKFFGQSIKTLPMGAIDEVFREIESGNALYGVVPIENSTEGVVNHTLDSFMESNIKICGEVELRIHHHLLSTGDELNAITKVLSHQQSLAQCREWLDLNLPKAERIAVSSNAQAAQMVCDEPNSAAIAGDLAAKSYKLDKLAQNIEDKPDNTTRFLAIAKDYPPASGEDKTSLLVSTQNKAGSLYQLLEPFYRHKISLSRIESRPSTSGMWEYVFFIDLNGHIEDEPVAKVFEELGNTTLLIKHLGSYPRAVL